MFPPPPVAVSVLQVLKETVNGEPDGVIAVSPVTVTVEAEPFPSVIVGAELPPTEVETFKGLGDATRALLPVPLTATENGLLAEFVPV